ncbi:MAG TPA: hypothetical protein VKE74_34000 [Gemmataceae bacterium]|nr:hypothetical protein [Gemmataceae bacterium]
MRDENCRANGGEVWSPLTLSSAERIARGEYRIEVPPLTEADGYSHPSAGYFEVVQFERDMSPSLDIVPADPEQYEASRVMNESVVADEVKKLEVELREWGALPSKRSLPDKLISGTFHEALDAYAEDIRTTAKRPSTDVLTPYGRLRTVRTTRRRPTDSVAPRELRTAPLDRSVTYHPVWRRAIMSRFAPPGYR